MLFTIAIPAYKDFYFKEAIESVISQKFEDWELIILDDCSPGKIQSISMNYTNDPRIRYYRNETNVGAIELVDNWNKCLELSKGDYIICMGDDDVLREDCLEVYAKYITEYPQIDVFHAGTEIIDEDSNFFRYQELRPLTESVYSMVWNRITRKRDQFIGDFLYKVSRLKECGGYYKLPLAWGADDITSYVCTMRNGIVNIPEFIFKYRVNRHTISLSGNTYEKLKASSSKYEWIIDNIIKSSTDNVEERNYIEMISSCIESSFLHERISIIAHSKDKLTIAYLNKIYKSRRLIYVNAQTIIIGLLYRFYLQILKK